MIVPHFSEKAKVEETLQFKLNKMKYDSSVLKVLPRVRTSAGRFLRTFTSLTKSNVILGGCALVVMGDESRSRGPGLESQCHFLDGHFSH